MNEFSCCTCEQGTTPCAIYNRPALPVIRYRVGTFSTFRRAMIESIAKHPLLAKWTSRDVDDYGIEIIELWAYLADILTFYQERLAHEAYLRTAQQRESLVQLAALVGYILRPGVAATAYLAFTVDKTQPCIPAGVRVQSKPASGQMPATFETDAALATSVTVNQFTIHSVPSLDRPNFRIGNNQAVVLAGGDDLKAGQMLVFFTHDLIESRRDSLEEKSIVSVRTTEGGKQIVWTPTIGKTFRYGATVYRYGRKFKLFGANAPEKYAVPVLDAGNVITGWTQVVTHFEWPFVESLPGLAQVTMTSGVEHIEAPPALKSTATLLESKRTEGVIKKNLKVVLPLDGVVTDLKVNDRVLVAIKGDITAHDFNQIFTIASVNQSGQRRGPITAVVTVLTLLIEPTQRVLPHMADFRTVEIYELTSEKILFSRRNFGDDRITEGSNRVYTELIGASDIKTGSLALIADGNGFAEAVTVTRVSPFDCTRVMHEMVTGENIVTENIAAIGKATMLDNGVSPKRELPNENGVVIEFTPPLTRLISGDRKILYGNVVKATHGETIKDETLGSGDRSLASQVFTLRKSPVTYTPDMKAPHGMRNSLQVWVDGTRWKEVPDFYLCTPDGHVFITRIDGNDTMHITFGDGVRGARLPSGTNNIHARYRKGSVKPGAIDAGKLTMLLDTGQGIQAVVNPAPTFGWNDPDTMAEIKRLAPTSVLTFDRAVSLRDFENLARSYPGVGKARAVWTWAEAQHVVRMTCASSDGTSIAAIAPGLRAFLDARRDPIHQLEIIDCTPVAIVLHASIVVDADHDEDMVLAVARVTMGNTVLEDGKTGYFSFARMGIGENIYLSDVYATMQSVPGVLGVDIIELHRGDMNVSLQTIVPIRPSEMVVLASSADIIIEIMRRS